LDIRRPDAVDLGAGEATLGVARDEGRRWIDELRREVGPPWAEDQKLAALAAWIALAARSAHVGAAPALSRSGQAAAVIRPV
jgi:hypothetical protein